MPTASPDLVERFATMLRWLTHAVATRGLTGQLSSLLVSAIVDRIRGINQRFARIARRVHAGRYAPRRSSPRQNARCGPRRRTPLPQANGWLLKLMPESAGSRAQLEHLFRDPEMAALLAAAPASLRRPLRSLCRMFGTPPPPVLAAPRSAPARPVRVAVPAAAPPPQPPPPAHLRPAAAPTRSPPARACGPPRPA